MKKKYQPKVLIGCLAATTILLIVIFVKYYQVAPSDGNLEQENGEFVQDETGANDENIGNEENAENGESGENTNDQPQITDIPQPIKPVFVTSEKSYFDDALFIGDSRTVGIYEYGDLKNADYFCERGLTIYELWEASYTVDGVGNTDLKNLLETKEYKKIYIMLGINELGAKQHITASTYKESIEQIQELVPEAIIYVCANLHVTASRSAEDELYNNTNINAFNEKIKKFADDKTIFYLDVNERFDDASGGFDKEYTNDNVHPKAMHYRDWTKWLCENTIQV